MTGAASPTGWTGALGTRLLAQARGWLGQGAPLFSQSRHLIAKDAQQACCTKAALQKPLAYKCLIMLALSLTWRAPWHLPITLACRSGNQ